MTNKTPLATVYDFDGTLALKNIREYFFIPEPSISEEEFWHEYKSILQHIAESY